MACEIFTFRFLEERSVVFIRKSKHLKRGTDMTTQHELKFVGELYRSLSNTILKYPSFPIFVWRIQ